MDDFALHIMRDVPNKASGEVGLRDMKIVMARVNFFLCGCSSSCHTTRGTMAIYQSIKEGRKVTLDWG